MMAGGITIAGGGLCGLSLGIALLRRGVPVRLHEAGSYPRHRVCGEFVSGVSRQTLDALGVADDLSDAVPLSTTRWFCAGGEIARFAVEGMGISRWRLDDLLQKRFRANGGELVTNSRLQACGEGVVRAVGRARCRSKWIGLKCHARNFDIRCDLEMHLGGNGYAGVSRIEGGMANICGFFRALPGAGGRDALAMHLEAGGLTELAARLASADPVAESFCAVAGLRAGKQPGGGFAAGDAAWVIPPFTGNGMSMAFESAEASVEPLSGYACGKLSWAQAAGAARAAQWRKFRARMRAAAPVHALLLGAPSLAAKLAKSGFVPFRVLLRLLR